MKNRTATNFHKNLKIKKNKFHKVCKKNTLKNSSCVTKNKYLLSVKQAISMLVPLALTILFFPLIFLAKLDYYLEEACAGTTDSKFRPRNPFA